MDAFTASRGRVAAVSDEQILDAYRWLAANEGVFCEPASAASVAGILAHGLPAPEGGCAAGDRRLRAHRPRPQGPRHGARQGAGGGQLRERARRRSSARSSTSALWRRPSSSSGGESAPPGSGRCETLREEMEAAGTRPGAPRGDRGRRPRRTPSRHRFPGLADDPHRRRRHPAARPRAADRPNLPRLPTARRARLAAARPRADMREALRRRAMRTMSERHRDRRRGAGLRAARHRRRAARAWRRLGEARGDRRLLDLQPLPLRAGLARPAARRRPRLRRARRPLPRGQLQRRRALPGRLLRGDARAGRARGRLAASLPARRDPGGRARLRRRARRRTSSSSTPTCGCATAALPTPTTTIPTQDAAWLREALDAVLDGREPEPAETEPVGCSDQVEAVELGDRAAAGWSAFPPPRPTSGPGYDVMAAALALHLELEVEETGEFSVDAGGLDVPTGPRQPRRAGLREPAPGRRLRFRIRSEIPLARGLGSSAAAIVAGLAAADHLFELALEPARDAGPGGRARGPPRQRRRGDLRRLRDLRQRRRRRPPRPASTRRRAWRRWR